MSKVLICLHVDTEGPLYESKVELFKRINEIFGLELAATDENLARLQAKTLDLGGIEAEVAQAVDPHSIGFKTDWGAIRQMLEKIMAPPFRNQMLDSAGKGWVFNWHVMDHAGYQNNPRRRDLGFLNIFDFYQEMIEVTGSSQDALHWHFHPVNFFGDAHHCATSYTNNYPLLNEVISRRVVERSWFPAVNRAGFHSERSDGHLFLEQWIPFDPSNQSVPVDQEPKFQRDLSGGRFGDWRMAPSDWSWYHPHHDNYQLPGQCRRVIARALNLKARHRSINVEEIEKAFKKAQAGEVVYLGLTNHDWRDMAAEVDEFRGMLKQVAARYPSVPFYFKESVEAFRELVYPQTDCSAEALDFEAKVVATEGQTRLEVTLKKGALFGPQPWLAIKTKGQTYHHDNFDLGEPGKSFVYVFDSHTLSLDQVESLGVAANDRYANQCIRLLHSGRDF
ncbi:MAG: hypothetical protein RRB13_08330 [bacterium]|nr:hypothetical protein [bacterium]